MTSASPSPSPGAADAAARRSARPSPLLELRAPLEAALTIALLPLWPTAPRGDGHAVLVLPGLTAGDASTALMRAFLDTRGWATHGWGQGPNLGFRAGVMQRLREQLRTLAQTSGRRVSLVGWSLGGIMARELAKQRPDDVRCVVTLGSPFTDHPRRTPTWRWTDRASGHHVGHDDLFGPLREAPPVPTTSIYSRSDSVVAWQHSVERPGPQAESIEVEASHLGLGLNPLVLWAVADRLAQPEGAWQPFARAGWQRWLYPASPEARAEPD
jgi:pimeloyl-ACP methyl ester carboxylesterase